MKNPSLMGTGLLAAALLAGCGGSGDSIYTPPAPTPMPLLMVDAFFATVKAAVAAMPEDTEAVGIDAMVATAPEDTEPAAL